MSKLTIEFSMDMGPLFSYMIHKMWNRGLEVSPQVNKEVGICVQVIRCNLVIVIPQPVHIRDAPLHFFSLRKTLLPLLQGAFQCPLFLGVPPSCSFARSWVKACLILVQVHDLILILYFNITFMLCYRCVCSGPSKIRAIQSLSSSIFSPEPVHLLFNVSSARSPCYKRGCRFIVRAESVSISFHFLYSMPPLRINVLFIVIS